MDTPITWLLEPDAFGHGDRALAAAVRDAGHHVVVWNDGWWSSREMPAFDERFVLFHGSLNNAARIRAELPFKPGAYCNTAQLACSAWCGRAAHWLLNADWRILPAAELVANPTAALAALGNPRSIFVRPDSALKPFSGRVLDADRLTLRALDFGFYYDSPDLPVLVAPARRIDREWRFVVANKRVLAGCGYTASTRAGADSGVPEEAMRFAMEVAAALEPPDPIFVLDICDSEGRMRLVEWNPFSGADLYGCDARAIVAGVADLAARP